MKRVLIDTMVVDLIADTPGLLDQVQEAARRGVLEVVTIHVLQDQLAAAKPERRAQLLAVYDALPKTTIATRGTVIGLWRMGQGRLGDGSESGVSVHEVRTARSLKGLADALFATTASGDADVLVTGDVDLLAKARRAASLRCEVWDLQQFVKFVQD